MQRRATKQSRGPNAAEKRFLQWLKSRPCVVSGATGVEVHHCMGSSAKQNKVLIGHWFCLPLSPEMHQSYHAASKAWRAEHGSQCDLWANLAIQYERETGEAIPNEVVTAIPCTNK